MSNQVKELLLQLLKDKEIQSIEDLLKKVEHFEEEDSELKIDNLGEYIERIKSSFSEFEKSHSFKVGDIVIWKSNMNNKRLPKVNQPVIVTDVLKEPIFETTKESSSAYFKEPLDIKIGLLHPDDYVFVTYYANSKRFRTLVE